MHACCDERHDGACDLTSVFVLGQIWQWVHHGRKTEDGMSITMEVVQRFIDQAREVLERELIAAGEDSEAVRVSDEQFEGNLQDRTGQ
jgi:malate synthase